LESSQCHINTSDPPTSSPITIDPTVHLFFEVAADAAFAFWPIAAAGAV
jgi:hypothetical protein